MNTENIVRAYKNLSVVERAFKSFKTLNLNVRPIHHRLDNRVRSHVFICMLAYMEKAIPFEQMTQPTSLQQNILHLLGVHL